MLAITFIAFPSCSKLAEKLTVKVPVEASIDLDIPAGGGSLKSGGKIFYVSTAFNIGTNETTRKYKDRIKSVAATGGKFRFSFPAGITSISLTNTVLTVRNVDTGILIAQWNFEAKTYDNNAEFTLSAPVGGSYQSFSTALDNFENLIIEFSGNSGKSTEGFKATYIVQMTIDSQVIG